MKKVASVRLEKSKTNLYRKHMADAWSDSHSDYFPMSILNLTVFNCVVIYHGRKVDTLYVPIKNHDDGFYIRTSDSMMGEITWMYGYSALTRLLNL